MIRILSTKKLLPNHRQFLLNAGLSVMEADFISIQYTPFKFVTIRQNLLFTSQNAFAGFLLNEESPKYKDRAIFCVGRKTKEAIEKADYTVTASADYAEALADIIIKEHSGEDFTFFSGSMRRDTLPDALAAAKIDCNEIEVYKTVLSPHIINSRVDGLLFFSPSGIESYLNANGISNETCFCIGNTTAEALKGITEDIIIAKKPTVENVIIQCINYYKEHI
ncbi:uroporphyrinogen-III synthase [Flavobacterium sp. DG1-102-2]|uniref:uroporphyrinogen-III synthase n=1 Tax=Flavobacterium sp. DG1-102-2 TaxID=3081663 RepID=UPI0029495E4C|nr:uroporphyrinogen-III synthase [Flavobacterium sp. DG1-102-2]MDV6167668.1 uroporphyrinogen-III synthase [Flavobacterium sp. DG1-102-2]